MYGVYSKIWIIGFINCSVQELLKLPTKVSRCSYSGSYCCDTLKPCQTINLWRWHRCAAATIVALWCLELWLLKDCARCCKDDMFPTSNVMSYQDYRAHNSKGYLGGNTYDLSSPREARSFHELRRYHTRPLRLNWGPKDVHFGKRHFWDLNINVRIFIFFGITRRNFFMFWVFH